MSISARRSLARLSTPLLTLLLAAACATPTPLPLPSADAGAVAGADADGDADATRPGEAGRATTSTQAVARTLQTLAAARIAAYPNLGPTPTPYDERAAVQALLPAGADFDLEQGAARYLRSADASLLPIYGITYTRDGRPGAAVVTRERPPRSIWNMDEQPELLAEATGARPMFLEGADGAFVLTTAEGSRLLLLALSKSGGHVTDILPLPEGDGVGELPYTLLRRDLDLSGDGRSDILLATSDDRVFLYLRQADDSLRLVHEVPLAAQMTLSAQGGLPEQIAPAGPGPWARSQWRDGAYQEVETLRDPALPTPQAIRDGALPPLPGSLTYVLHAERKVLRWPAAGGGLRELWRAKGKETGLRGLRVSQGGAVLLAVAEGGDHSPAHLLMIDAAGRPHDLPTHGALRDFEISDDGAVAVYVGLGVDQTGSAANQGENEAIEPEKRGAVFAVEQTSPDLARGLADCEAVSVSPSWTVGCLGDLALSSDGRQVAYGDGKGLHTVGVDEAAVTTVVEPYLVDDPSVRIYWPKAWSPDGRRLLAFVGGWEGRSPVVVNLPAGKPREVRGASEYISTSELVWLPDSQALFVTRWPTGGETSAELRVVAADDPSRDAHTLGRVPLMTGGRRVLAYGPAVAPDGGLRFGTRHPDAAVWQGNGVFSSGPGGADLRRLVTLPPLTRDDGLRARELLAWSPDGAAFVVRFADGQRLRSLVGLADGSAVWDASSLLNEADWLTWSR